MKFRSLAICTASLAYALTVAAQSTFTMSSCVPGSGVTAFPNCNSLYDTINSCAGPSVSAGAPYIACMCNQALFSNFFGCENEQRLCLGNGDLDGSFETGIAEWHSTCDNKTSSAITTPPISTITASYNQDFCTTIYSACNSASIVDDQCSSSYQGKAFLSCLCGPQELSLAYTCEFLGNTSCLETPAALTNMALYPFCTDLVSVLGGMNGTVPASSNATVTSAMGSPSSTSSGSETASSTGPITQPVLPGASQSNPSAKPTKTSVGVISTVPNAALSVVCWGTLAVAFLFISR